MKLIDIERSDRSLQQLLALAQREHVVLAREGQVLARVQKFTAEDLEDAMFEHDSRVIRQGDLARKRFERGEGRSLADVRAELGLQRTGKKRRPGRS